MIISIQAEDRMGWQYTVTHGVSGTEATQNWAICFIGNPTGNFTFKIAVLKINSNRFFIPIKEGIRYKGDDSIMNVANIPNNTVYFRIIMMDEIHPVLLSSGGILVGYLLQPDYYRQMF